RNSASAAAHLLLRAKATPDKTADLFAILRDVLLAARLDNRERIKQLVLEERADQEAELTQRGASYVDLRLRAGLHEAGWAAEQMEGISNLLFMRRLADRIDSEWDTVRDALERMRAVLVDRAAAIVNVTTDTANWRRCEPELAGFLEGLPLSDAVA